MASDCIHGYLRAPEWGFKTEIFNVLEATIVVLLTLIFPKEVSVVRFKIKEGHNLFKPNYSSFKFGGIQLRGKNAAMFQLLYILVILCVNTIKFFWHISIAIFWFGFLILKWLIAFSIGFFKGFKAASL
jgi:hypothetical protein